MKKIFSKKIIRPAAGVLMALILIGGGVYGVLRVSASATDNVHGWLWSDAPNQSDQNMTCTDNDCGRGLGWISMNSVDTGAGGTYGVNLNTTTGQLIGKGWSEFGGFLQFDVNGPYPQGVLTANKPAGIDPACLAGSATTCNVTGWARFMEAPSSNQAGGWDGWVSLGGQTSGNQPYGVVYNKSTGKFSGKAWGDINAGWIEFGVPTDGAYVNAVDVCYDEAAYPVTIGNQTTVPPGYHTETILVYPHTGPGQPPGHSQPYTIHQVCRPDTVQDLCSNLKFVQSAIPAQYNGTWYYDLNQDGVCEPLTSIDLCKDVSASNYNAPLPCIYDPLNPPVLPTPTIDLCTNANLPGAQTVLPYYNSADNTWYDDPNGDKFCTKTSDLCQPLPPGNQSPNATNTWNAAGIWYGLANNICIMDVCKDTADLETQGFQAIVPFTGSNGSVYVIDSADGVCKKQSEATGGQGGTGTKPTKPIYKEN